MRKITSLLVILFCLVPLWQAIAQEGNTCSDPIVISSLPFNTTDDTANYTNEYSGPPGTGCGTASQYLFGNEAIYAYTSSYTGEVSLTLSPEEPFAGIFVYDNCADIGVVCYADGYAVNGNSTADLNIMFSVEEGETYYILASMWGTPEEQTYAYTLDVDEVSCSRPGLVSVDSVSFEEAVVSWAGNADSYEYVLSTSSSEPTSAGTITTETEVIFTDLTEGNTYYFWVRSLCEDEDVSAWAAPVSFRAPGQGDTCDAAIEITGLPFTTTDNTGNYANEYNGVPGATCGTTSNYLDGNNVVYTFTATANTALQITLESSASNKGVFVYDTCDNIGSFCNIGAVESSGSEDIVLDLYVEIGETYYVLLSTWPTPQTMPYTLSIDELNCAVPGSISLDAATPTTADFSWGAMDDVDSFDYAITTSDTAPSEETGNTTDSSIALTDLTSDTDYYFWLRSVCGSTTTDWTPSFHFFTGYCMPVYTNTGTGDYITKFQANSIIDELNYTANSQPTDRYENNSDVILQVYEGQTVEFNTEYTGGVNGVKIWIDANNNMQFDDLEVRYDGNSNSFSLPSDGQEGEFTIPQGIDNGNYRMRLRSVYGSNPDFDACNSQTYGSTIDFTIEVVDAPTCPHVENITLDAATPTTATVSWNANASAEGYIVEYGIQGFEHGDGTEIETTDSSVDIDGLVADTNYEVYVRANCGDDDLSYWGSSLKFFTGYCEPSYSASTGDYLTSVTTEGGFIDIDYSHSGPGGYYNEATEQVVVAPGMEFEVNTSYIGGSNTVKAWIDWNSNMTFENAEEVFEEYSTSADKTFTVEVPADMEPGSYRFRIGSRYSNNDIESCGGSYTYGSTVDFTLVVSEEPECMPVSDLVVEALSFTSIEVTWDGPDNAESWNVEYVIDNGAPGAGVSQVVTTNSAIIDGLEEDTNYSIYVYPECEEEDGLVRGTTVFTGYCEPTYNTSASDYLSSITTDGGFIDIDYSHSGPGGYYNEATEQVVVAPGMEFEINTSYIGGSNTVKAWIDWNANMTFENAEEVFEEYSTSADKTFTVEVPADMEPGSYRFRIGSRYGNNDIDSCGGSYTYGSTVDFTLVVSEEPECMPVSDLVAEALSFTEVEVSWEGPDNADTWEVEYVEGGGPQGSGVTETATTNSLTIEGLVSDTDYDIYVTPTCTGEDGLTRTTTVYTGYCSPKYTSTGDYLKEVNTENALNNINYEVTSRPENGYDNRNDLEIVAFAGSSFDFDTRYQGGAQGIKVWIDGDNSLSFDDDEVVYYETTTNATQEGVINVPSDLEPGDYRIRFVSVYGSATAIDDACGDYTHGSTVDFTLVVVEMDCMPATDITFSADANNNITISWTGNEDVAEWEIEYGVRDFTPGEGTTVTSSDTSYLITDLVIDTEYDFYITGDCADEEGMTIGPKRFFFGYCIPNSQYGQWLSSITTDGAFVDLDYSANSQVSNGYDNQSDMQLVIIGGQEVDITTVYSAGSNGVNAWVDWDRSMSFEDSEKIYTSTGSNATQDGSIDFPEDITPGTYRMRVRGQGGTTANPPACGEVNYGSTVDFTLIVLDGQDCLPPLQIETTAVYTDGIEITWTDNAENPESWEIEYGRTGFIQGEGTIVAADAKPFLIEGLDSSSASDFATYDFYVRAICAGEDTGNWSPLPHTESTLCGPTGVPYILDFESSVTPDIPACSSQQVGAGSNAWYTEYNPGYYLGETTVLRFDRNDVNAADSWFFTSGVELEAGVWYTIAYDYMTGNPQFAESLKVAMGTGTNATDMTMVLADYPELTISNVEQDMIEFRVEENGVYYFGFHAYSDAAQFSLFLDNIKVDFSLGVESLVDITFSMYPNPATSNVQVESSSTIERITVYNMLGQTIENVTPMSTNYNLNVEDFQTGTYLLEIEADGKRESKQLIKK